MIQHDTRGGRKEPRTDSVRGEAAMDQSATRICERRREARSIMRESKRESLITSIRNQAI